MAGAALTRSYAPISAATDRFKRRLGCQLLSINAYPDSSAADHSEFSRRCTANIDDPSAAVGTAVIDAHDHGPTVANVGDAHLRSEGKRAMRSGKPIWAGHFAAGGAATTIVRGIPRFGPGSAERSNQGKRNNSDGETIDGHSASISRNRPSCKAGVSADPSVFRIRLLYGLLIMGHGRRQIIWFGDGPSPTAEWIANQITETCGWEQIPRYLIRDRDGAYGHVFIRRLRSMGIRDRPTSPRSPDNPQPASPGPDAQV